MEELSDGFTYAISWDRVQEGQAANTNQCWSEVRAGPEGLHSQNPKMTGEDPDPRLKSEDFPGDPRAFPQK